MNRRAILRTIGGGSTLTLAGCLGDTGETDADETPSPTPQDSDGDGVPDSHDYAPRDPDVQVEADVQRMRTPTESDSPTPTRTRTPSPTLTATPTPTPTPRPARTIQANSDAAVGYTHHLLTYSREHVEVRFYGDLIDASYSNGAQVLVVARSYPDSSRAGDVLSYTRGDVIPNVNSDETVATVHFDERVSSNVPFYFSCLLVPAGMSISELSSTNTDTLCQSDRLTIRSGRLQRDRHSIEPDSVSTSRYERTNSEGAYLLRFSGSTFGNSWNAGFTAYKHGYIRGVEARQYTDYREYVYEAHDDGVADGFAALLAEEATSEGITGKREQVEFLIDFVQNLPYVPDDVSTGADDYAKRMVESLVDGGGDCEDSAIMLASLLTADSFGYGTALFLLPGHMAVGVKGGEDIAGTYYEKDNVRYYYIETTGRGWGVGEIPEEYENESAYIYVL